MMGTALATEDNFPVTFCLSLSHVLNNMPRIHLFSHYVTPPPPLKRAPRPARVPPPRCEDIIEGEPAELLVLSQDDSFFNFKV